MAELARQLLLLFDIDGTLLAGATDAHRDALHAALLEVHGVDVSKQPLSIAPAGRTDPEIARVILLDAGVSADRIDEHSAAVREACGAAYARLCTEDLSHTVLPGVRDALAWAAREPDLTPSLVTGNYEPVARLKLRRAGISAYFPAGQGAFGSDAEDRAMLPAIARRRAGTGAVPHPREQTIVIGDTPRDIACARADGCSCIAVSSGPFGADELTSADRIVADASALPEAIRALASGTGSASSGPRPRQEPAGAG